MIWNKNNNKGIYNNNNIYKAENICQFLTKIAEFDFLFGFDCFYFNIMVNVFYIVFWVCSNVYQYISEHDESEKIYFFKKDS